MGFQQRCERVPERMPADLLLDAQQLGHSENRRDYIGNLWGIRLYEASSHVIWLARNRALHVLVRSVSLVTPATVLSRAPSFPDYSEVWHQSRSRPAIK